MGVALQGCRDEPRHLPRITWESAASRGRWQGPGRAASVRASLRDRGEDGGTKTGKLGVLLVRDRETLCLELTHCTLVRFDERQPSGEVVLLLRKALFSLPCALRLRTALSPRSCAAFNGQASAVAFVNSQTRRICCLTLKLSGCRRQGAWAARRMMPLAASRPKCLAGGSPLERPVRPRRGTLSLRR